METKKSDRADINRKSTLFFSVGLFVSMGLIVFAFEKRQYQEALVDQITRSNNPFDDLMDVPITELTPPPPPAAPVPVIVEVPTDEKIEDDISIAIDAEAPAELAVPEIPFVEPPVENTETVFIYVEEPASPKGGIAAFYKFVNDKIKYPAQARRMGIEGRVFVEFVIDKDGSISDVKFVKGIGASCDEEAVRVVKSAPAWTPGKQRGKPVKQRMVLPITFRLG
jgi:periplasmic protein TonB